MKLVEKAVEKLVKEAVERERTGRPPVCAGSLYQSDRPVRETDKHEDEDYASIETW